MLEVYSNLSKCDEFVGLSQSESYFVTLNQRWCFLPLFWPLKVQALLPLLCLVQANLRLKICAHVVRDTCWGRQRCMQHQCCPAALPAKLQALVPKPGTTLQGNACTRLVSMCNSASRALIHGPLSPHALCCAGTAGQAAAGGGDEPPGGSCQASHPRPLGPARHPARGATCCPMTSLRPTASCSRFHLVCAHLQQAVPEHMSPSRSRHLQCCHSELCLGEQPMQHELSLHQALSSCKTHVQPHFLQHTAVHTSQT